MDIDYFRVQTRLAQLGFDPGPIDGVRGGGLNIFEVRE